MSFGKTTPGGGRGSDPWLGHDGTKGWSDDGQVEAVLGPAGSALRQIIGNHVRDAVYEYAHTAEHSLVVHQGQLYLQVRYWNAEADFHVRIALRELVASAAKQAMTNAADPKAQALLTALAGLAKDLAVGLSTKKK